MSINREKTAGCHLIVVKLGRDRNTVRAALSGELRIHAPFRYVQRVLNSTMTHVSASLPVIPEGQISRFRLAAMAFLG